MLPLLQFGALASPPALLAGLVVVALVLLVGRLLLKLAWRIVIAAAIVVATVWILGLLGFQLF